MVDFARAVPYHREPGCWSEALLPSVEERLAETPCHARQVVEVKPGTVADSVEPPEMSRKGGVGQLERMVRRGVDALEFELGHGRYCGPAIEQYFETLSTRSHLRVIVVDEPGGKLFGIYEAPDLISSLRISGAEGYDRLAGLLNRSARLELARLPGFVAGSDAVSGGTSRRASEAESDERVSAKTRATGRWPLFLKDPRLRTWRGTIPSAPAGR